MVNSGLMGKLAGQTAIYGVSSVIARLLNYLLVPYFTRIMTTAQFGVYTDMYAVIPFVLVLLTMGMESGYFRFAGKAQSQQDNRRVYATAWGAVGVVSVIFMTLVGLLNTPIANAMGYPDNREYILLVAAIVFVDAVSAIPFARLRERGKAVRYVILRLVSVIIHLGGCLVFYIVLDKNGVSWVLIANLIASSVTFFLLLLSRDNRILPRIDAKLFRRILLYSLPLLISGIAGTANEFIDRQMIKYLLPTDIAFEALGIYGAVVKIGVVMIMFTQMYRLAAEPFFLAEFKGDDFQKSTAAAMKYYIIVSVAIFLGITLFTPLFGLIVGADFREGLYILPIVLVSNMLGGVVLNLSFWYKQKEKTIWAIVVTGTGLIFTIVFNILLVPTLGYFGAAIARLICETAMVVVSYAINQRFAPIPYPLARIGEYLIIGAAIYFIGMFAAEYGLAVRYIVAVILLFGFGAYVLKREKLRFKL